MKYEESIQDKVFANHTATTPPKESRELPFSLLGLYHWLSYPHENPEVKFDSFTSQGYTVCPHCGQTLSKFVLNLMYETEPPHTQQCPFCQDSLTRKPHPNQQTLETHPI